MNRSSRSSRIHEPATVASHFGRIASTRAVACSAALAIAAFLAASLAACADEATSANPAASAPGIPDLDTNTDPRAGWPDSIRFGLVPSEGGTDIIERFEPMADFLAAELGVGVRPFSASAYAGVITAMRNDQIELAYFGPKSYVEAARLADAEAIAMELNDAGEPGYQSLIIVHTDSPFRSLADLEGQTFGLVAPNSTSGYLVPTIGIIRETGRTPNDFFGRITFTGSHGASMKAVEAQDLPAAATNTLDMTAMANAGQVDTDRFRVVWTSEMIPGSAIAVRGDLPVSLKDALAQAVLAFNTQTDALASMSRRGYIAATDDDYRVIRLLEQKKIELTEQAGDG